MIFHTQMILKQQKRKENRRPCSQSFGPIEELHGDEKSVLWFDEKCDRLLCNIYGVRVGVERNVSKTRRENATNVKFVCQQ
jgi:hypothetical protein